MRMRPQSLVPFPVLRTAACEEVPPASSPEGTLTVAVATFGNQRWRPLLYVGAVVSKSCVCAKNLGPKAPLLAVPDAYLFLCYGNPYNE